MGKAYRKQILNILDLLNKMNEEIQKAILGQRLQLAQQLLIDSQEAAISLGNSIEKQIGEETKTVKALEEYCEILFKLYEALSQKDQVKVLLKILQDQCRQIGRYVEDELPDRYEMVFLPYKVSMWDSLESVWKAADEDPDCDAYVIPIPYYDKNPDGSFRSEHYEGDAFPKNVPIIHYTDYDFENRHPDVIFIHNPYDQYNYVTSVHPSFYSDKLKEYTEKLVYIPYYVSSEINPDSREAIEGRAGFALTRGVINSDIVIVQSDNIKKLFVNILNENIPDIERSYWENKIWGLGSPKLDRVNNVQRDDEKLPETWKRVIFNKAGNRKKVVLYNISVSTLLQNPDMLNKIRDVLRFFKSSEEVALWWRPHPLYESTLASMRPQLLEEYQKIVNQYRQEAWGIFDEGVDLEWAIAESDAYYGDKSSVVQLYREAKKPVLIQNILVKTGEEISAENIPIWPSAFYVDGDDIWFVHGKINVLLRYNMSENHTYVIGTIPNEPMFQECLYSGIYKWEDRIFLIPCWAREIAVYDIINGKFDKIPINNIEFFDGKILFNKVYAKNRFLYCIPYYYDAILKIDMENSYAEYLVLNKENEQFINDTTRIDDKIIAILAYTNVTLILNLEDDTVSKQRLGQLKRRYTNVANIGEALYLFDREAHSIVKVWGNQYAKEEEIGKISNEGIKMTSAPQDLMIIDSIDDEELYTMDADKNIIFETEKGQRILQNSLGSAYCSGVENDGDENSDTVYYYNKAVYSMCQFSRGNLKRRFSMTLRKEELDKLNSLILQIEELEICENSIYELKLWLYQLGEQKIQRKISSQSCGEKIIKSVKEIIND